MDGVCIYALPSSSSNPPFLSKVLKIGDKLADRLRCRLVHGGAWRSPNETAENFLSPVLSTMYSSPFYNPGATQQIAGWASINYRLSPHPKYPQNPNTTDPYELRDAKHPEHIRDVRSALRLLQKTYGFGRRYILAGHSCGATLSFQCVMPEFDCNTGDSGIGVGGGGGGGGADSISTTSPSSSSTGEDISSATDDGDGYAHPLAILGTEGIYDIRQLQEANRENKLYRQFSENAFGPDKQVWDFVSPAVPREDGSSSVALGWRGGRLAVLAHSVEDNLVDVKQLVTMKDSLVPWEEQQGIPTRKVVTLSLIGEHNDPWMRGDEFARALTASIQELQQLLLVS